MRCVVAKADRCKRPIGSLCLRQSDLDEPFSLEERR
jgi:hypothetical protein